MGWPNILLGEHLPSRRFPLGGPIHFDIFENCTARKIHVKMVNVFWSDFEKFVYSSRERETRYDRNIRAIELIRDRSGGLESLARIEENGKGGETTALGRAQFISSNTVIVHSDRPNFFRCVFSGSLFFSHRSLLAFERAFALPIDGRFGDSGSAALGHVNSGKTDQIGV